MKSLHSPWARGFGALALATSALLAACSDSPQEETVAPPLAASEVPASAFASASAYTDFARSLAKSETGKPLDLNKAGAAPTSESASPAGI